MSKKLEEIFTDITNINNKSKKLKKNYIFYKCVIIIFLFGILFIFNYDNIFLNSFYNIMLIQNIIILFLIYIFL